MLPGMMLYLQKTRPETHSMAFENNSKTTLKQKKSLSCKNLNYNIYSKFLSVLSDAKESIRIMVHLIDSNLG